MFLFSFKLDSPRLVILVKNYHRHKRKSEKNNPSAKIPEFINIYNYAKKSSNYYFQTADNPQADNQSSDNGEFTTSNTCNSSETLLDDV